MQNLWMFEDLGSCRNFGISKLYLLSMNLRKKYRVF
jgi:hypothetical protein